MKSKEISSYYQLSPSPELRDFVDSYWKSSNFTDKALKRTILPDSFFKVITTLIDGEIAAFFLTGLWLKETEIEIPAKATVYGIKFKILAPEYILKREIASLLQSQIELDLDFWNIRNFQFDSLQGFVMQAESVLIEKLAINKQIKDKKLKLSQLLYRSTGNIPAKEVSDQITWSNRQINRYLNKYIGVSLKTYLNVQKVYSAYIPIREGNFSPDPGYYDQSHLIKEIKKYTGQTPRKLLNELNDRFIQLKNIKKD